MQQNICNNMHVYAFSLICIHMQYICSYMYYTQIYSIQNICKNMHLKTCKNMKKYGKIWNTQNMYAWYLYAKYAAICTPNFADECQYSLRLPRNTCCASWAEGRHCAETSAIYTFQHQWQTPATLKLPILSLRNRCLSLSESARPYQRLPLAVSLPVYNLQKEKLKILSVPCTSNLGQIRNNWHSTDFTSRSG